MILGQIGKTNLQPAFTRKVSKSQCQHAENSAQWNFFILKTEVLYSNCLAMATQMKRNFTCKRVNTEYMSSSLHHLKEREGWGRSDSFVSSWITYHTFWQVMLYESLSFFGLDWSYLQELSILVLPVYSLHKKSKSNSVLYPVPERLCVVFFPPWSIVSLITKCYRLPLAIRWLLQKYYQCDSSEQWLTVTWVVCCCRQRSASTQLRVALQVLGKGLSC